jgi:hypothetical protein
MRARIRIADIFDMEFEGTATAWNELLRPLFGGPPAEERAPSATSPSRVARPSPEHTGTVYAQLAEIGGRRGEKDAVLVAVWEHDGMRRDVGFDEVARTVHALDAFRDVRVKPHLLKHVNRSRMLDAGNRRESVRLTAKGRRYVESLGR